jgi:hypothetical protein
MGVLSNLRLAPGLFTEATDRGADGRWKDGNMVRWNNGLPETVGGWVSKALSGAAFRGIARSVIDWATLDGIKVAAIGTNQRLYLLSAGVLYNITPLRATGTLTDPLTTVNGSSLVTVNHSSHSVFAGDYVFFRNATEVGGVTVDGEYQVVSITDVDNYVIDVGSNATSSATGGGAVIYEYEISIGGSASGLAFGWGSDVWGAGTWGTPRTESTLIIPLRVWSLDTWGEDLIASPSGGAVYWWDRSGGFSTRAQLIENAPRRNISVMVSPENRQLICLGTTDDGGALDALLIRWSDSEDFTTFDIEAENNAGSQRIDAAASELVAGVRTRSGIVMFTDQSIHLMQPTGDALVYEFRQLGSGVSLAGPNAVIDAQGVVFLMSVDNFYIYDGVLRVMPCDIWTRVFRSFNVEQRRMVYAARNNAFSEIWWFYPSAGSNTNDRVAVYNYRDNLWWYGNLGRSAFHDFSPLYNKPYGFDDDGVLYTHEDGESDDGDAIERYLISEDIEVGEGQEVLHINKLIPDFKELTGTAAVTLRGRLHPAAPVKTNGPHSVTSSTRKVSTRMRARQVSLTITMGTLNGRFRMGEWRAEAEQEGSRI